MNPSTPDRVESFKEAIGFDRIPLPKNRDEGVAAEWGDPRTIAGLSTVEWSVLGDLLIPSQEGAERKWDLKKGGEIVTITVFVSSAGPGAARRHLLARATDTMMTDIPYRKGPEGPGELSVTTGPKGNEDFIWFYRNICGHVLGMDTRADVLGMAQAIQKLAQRSLVDRVSDQTPKIKSLSAPAEVRIGVVFPVRVDLGPDADAARYAVAFEAQDVAVKVEDYEGFDAKLRAASIGVGKVQVRVIDKKTLLTTVADFKVGVQPPRPNR